MGGMKRLLCAALLFCGPVLAQDVPRTTVAGSADFKEQASTPAVRANHGRLFTKISDSGLYYLRDDGTETNLLTGGASAAAILSALLTVDGAGSGLDADLLDGVSGDGYCLVDGTRAFTGNVTMSADLAVNGGDITSSTASPTLFAGCTGSIHLAGGSASTGCSIDCTTGTLTCTVEVGGSMTAAEILAALLTVDGPGSGLDADTLDGTSSAGFVTTGTYTAADVLAKLLTVDGTGSGVDADTLDGNNVLTDAQVSDTLTCSVYSGTALTDAQVADTITASNYLPLAGGTMTGTAHFSGVTTDITVPSGEDFIIGATSQGETAVFRAVDGNRIDLTLYPIANNVGFGLQMTADTSAGTRIQSTLTTKGIINFTETEGIRAGSQADNSSNTATLVVADTVAVPLVNIYGDGAIGVVKQQAITISTGTDTTSPTSSQVELTCTTAPCTYSPGETNVVDGWQIAVCNVDTADSISLASASGTVVVANTPATLAPDECAACVYTGSIWSCREDVSGGGSSNTTGVKVKTADTVRTDTTTATADPDLTFNVVSGETYMIEGTLRFETTSTHGQRWGIGGTATASQIGVIFTYFESAFASSGQGYLTSVGSTFADGVNGNTAYHFRGSFVATASGTVAVIWAQSTLDAVQATRLKAGSSFAVTEVH